MIDKEPNYVKEVLNSPVNLAFLGIMVFAMFLINFWGFAMLAAAGELAAVFFIAQLEKVQYYIRLKKQVDGQDDFKSRAEELAKDFPSAMVNEFKSVTDLCDKIEQYWKKNIQNGDNALLSDLISKLGSFRFEYARMLQAYVMINSRISNTNAIAKLKQELESNLNQVKVEQSKEIVKVLKQNIRVLSERLKKIIQEGDIQRLIATRLSLVKNSLNLLQDEVYRASTPKDLSASVGNLLSTLNIDEELKSTYDDVIANYPKSQSEYQHRSEEIEAEQVLKSLETAHSTNAHRINSDNVSQARRSNVRKINQG